MSLSFRAATRADLPCLRALAIQVFLDTYATEGVRASLAREVEQQFAIATLQAQLDRGDGRILLVEQAGHLIAFAQLRLAAPHEQVDDDAATELERLYVQPAFQRRGVGGRLLAEVEQLARGEASTTLWLTAWLGNARALAFYRSQGYHELGSTTYAFEDERYENRLFAKSLAGLPYIRAP